MRLGILEAGEPPPALAHHGSYAAMFCRLLGEKAYDYKLFDIRAGDYPARTEDCIGYIVTGSACGVYEDLPWIGELMAWLRTARERTALVGICFGHQALAQAFGGQVAKSDKGWGVGLHRYDIGATEPWMFPRARAISIPVSHQDQVVAPPPDARVIASCDFTPYAGLAWDDAMSFQCHPEFQPEYAAALVEARRGRRVPEAVADEAIASLARPNDRAVLTAWIRAFLMLTPPPVEGEGSGI